MALNKSNKSTPSSRSGYLREITASVGKTNNFLLPVRIKITPNTTIAPLSDGKKDYTKMMQPVLIKDLLQSTQKNKTVMSASTQKKKARTQSYLNTQSCYKPKQEDPESSFLSRKSFGGNKVRRQLYQNLDSPQRSILDGKENLTKNVKPKGKLTRNSEVPATKSSHALNNSRKSLLLPPNSIRNSIMRKSENVKPPGKQNAKNNTTDVKKSIKSISRITEKKSQKTNVKKIVQKTEDDIDIEMDFSSPDVDECNKKKTSTTRDCGIMTSPHIYRDVYSNKQLSNSSELHRPSVIMSPNNIISTSKNFNKVEPPCQEMRNLNINLTEDTCINFTQINYSDFNGFLECKTYLEQSIQACEEQALKLKQVLNFVNTFCINAKTSEMELRKTQINQKLETDEKCDISLNTNINYQDTTDITDIHENSLDQKKEIIDDGSTAKTEIIVFEDEEKSIKETINKLPIPIKILVTKTDLEQEAKEISNNTLNDLARLSTIGEVSYEVDLSNKDEKDQVENKENINGSSEMLLTPTIVPQTPKISSRKSLLPESCERRRSARLAAKRRSPCIASDTDSDKQDSFTLLENELNVVHSTKLSSKSLPASPMKPPPTPGYLKQWDKRVERPLREYMSLKMNGTFLITPDAKRFQSQIEPTDTPHSRKSLSRKIFMELCDLYAESPEQK